MKKGAIELSIGTIVIIVLAMTMLILGLVLVRTIFTGATYNIQTMNDKVRDEINKLFTEDKKTVIYLGGNEAKIKQGETWGIAFGIKNLEEGVAGSIKFDYEVKVSDPDINKKCGVNEATAESWIMTGRADSMSIASGDAYQGIVRFNIPTGAPLCTIRYHLEVSLDGDLGKQAHATDFFDITIKAK